MMRVSSTVCGTEGSIETADDFNNKVNGAIGNNGWVVFLLHGIDNDGGWSPVTSANMSEHLTYMDENRDDFWVATYGDAVKYIRERDNSSLVELSNVDDVITIELANELDTDIYNLPITIQREMTGNWLSAVVEQNGKTEQAEIVDYNGSVYLRFNAVPNAGDIIIRGNETVGTTNANSPLRTLNVFPNPSSDSSTLSFTLKSSGNVSISIVDETGRLVKEIANEKYPAGEYQFPINTSEWADQIMFCVVSVDGVVQSKKLIVQ